MYVSYIIFINANRNDKLSDHIVFNSYDQSWKVNDLFLNA